MYAFVEVMLFLVQFFNPGAFAPVNAFPQALSGTNPSESQDDAVNSSIVMIIIMRSKNNFAFPV